MTAWAGGHWPTKITIDALPVSAGRDGTLQDPEMRGYVHPTPISGREEHNGAIIG